MSVDNFAGPIRARKQAAPIHRSATVSHATSDVLRAKASVAPGCAEGTMSLVLLAVAAA